MGLSPSWYGLFLQKMKRPICMTFGTLAAAALPLLSLGAETECVPSLPPKLTASLQSSYPRFHVLNLKELNPDDQKIWQASHHDACPGIVSGDFLGKRRAYAVLIVSEEGKQRKDRVVVMSWKVGDSVESRQIYKEEDVVNFPVIRIGAPGVYEDVERHTKLTARDGVILIEHLESAVTAVLLYEGKVRTLTLSN